MCNPNCTSPGTKIGQGGLGALGIGPGNLELAEELFLTEWPASMAKPKPTHRLPYRHGVTGPF